MCKETCKNKCQPGAHFKDCGPGARGQAMNVERTAQHTPAVKIPVGLRGSGKTPVYREVQAVYMDDTGALVGVPHTVRVIDSWHQLQEVHAQSAMQNLMQQACAVAAELAALGADQKPLTELMLHVGTQDSAMAELKKLLIRVGLRNWFDGDFVVLSNEEARRVAAAVDPAGFGRGVLDMLEHRIRTAAQ